MGSGIPAPWVKAQFIDESVSEMDTVHGPEQLLGIENGQSVTTHGVLTYWPGQK